MTNSGAGMRPQRVGDRIRTELMELVLRGQIREPGVAGAVVQSVAVTADLGVATIYLRTLEEPTPARKKALLRGFGRARGFLRSTIGKRLGLRTSPELRFVWDDGVDHALRIDELLHEIQEDRRTDERTKAAAPATAAGESVGTDADEADDDDEAQGAS